MRISRLEVCSLLLERKKIKSKYGPKKTKEGHYIYGTYIRKYTFHHIRNKRKEYNGGGM